ncbi:hypothetical protein [uncultured Parvibaculum sp.]|uniref:hypothetical protein n=1 Tax=uncultured Parvibaculum sp. TaxID=291828 RepID=UPI0030D7398A|tara:strand:- start:3263 stop:3781 length:519 start_codon:yes stop_codon:yes gene_type:complete
MSTTHGGSSRPQLNIVPNPQTASRPVLTSSDYARLEAASFEDLDLTNPMRTRVRAKLVEAKVVPGAAVADTVATLGSIVRYRIEGRMAERRMMQLQRGPAPNGQYLSVLTPIGLALFGQSAGDIVEAELFDGARLKLELTGIDFQPEADIRRRMARTAPDGDGPDNNGPEAV